jgi:hypothetical protein
MMIYRLSMLKWLQNQGKLDTAKALKIMTRYLNFGVVVTLIILNCFKYFTLNVILITKFFQQLPYFN